MFEFIINFFYIVLYQPLFNLLVFLYNYTPGHDFGLTIIFLTIIIRLAIFPLSVKVVNSQRNLQKLQPKLQEIQKKYKSDKQKQGLETLNLYRSEKVNPFSGVLLAFIQLPILICLYRVFLGGLNPKELSNLYSFVANPGQIQYVFLHLIDLSKPNLVFAFFAGLTQFFQTKMLLPKDMSGNKKAQGDVAQAMQKQMTYILPIFTVLILTRLPAALGLYWIASGVFSVVQQYFILKKSKELKPTENN